MTWEEAIYADLQWRNNELASLKRIAMGQLVGTDAYAASLRAAWAMLYAHFEGFCLFVLNSYLSRIRFRQTFRVSCQQPLVVFSLQKEIKGSRNLPDSECFDFISRDVHNLLAQVIDFPEGEESGDFEIGGRSNMWPDKLAQSCAAFCLKPPTLDPTDWRLRLLVGRRNRIAHGRKLEIRDLKQYSEYEAHTNAGSF